MGAKFCNGEWKNLGIDGNRKLVEMGAIYKFCNGEWKSL
jgi:hypothetical protein